MMDMDTAYSAFLEALQKLAENIKRCAEQLQQFAAAEEREEEYRQQSTRKRMIPPRTAASRARSPSIQRYWVNYHARDRLPCKSLKTGANPACGAKRAKPEREKSIPFRERNAAPGGKDPCRRKKSPSRKQCLP